MRPFRILLALVAGVVAGLSHHASSAAAEPPADWEQSVVKAWPGLARDEPCLTQRWQPGRTLVWARPGKDGTAQDVGNWIEYPSAADYRAGKAGKPAAAGPDANTDLLLPAAPENKRYIVGFMADLGKRRERIATDSPSLACRHITIERGAGLDGECGISRGHLVFTSCADSVSPVEIHGNVTVADGGCLYGSLRMVGDRHTWLLVGKSPEPLGRSLSVRKDAGASVTLMADRYDLVDGLTVASGRLVLAPAATVRINATLEARKELGKLGKIVPRKLEPYGWIRKGAALEMRAGSRIGRVNPAESAAADLRVQGLLQIGRAGVPAGVPAVIELTSAEGDGQYLHQPGGLYIQPTAEVRNYGSLSVTEKGADPATAGKGISIFLEKPVDLGKVTIDYLRAGGIAATDRVAANKATSTATFGKHCAATGDSLYSKIDFIDFAGGMGTVEFVDGLTTECRILYPHAGRLVVRSRGNRTLQSFDLKSVHAVTINGTRTEYNPRRPLNDDEKRLRKFNALWADVPGKGQAGRYGNQQWPDCPVMVWARPGTSGACSVGPNWLDETGRPCFDVPWASQPPASSNITDIDTLLPAAETPYAATGSHHRGSKGTPLLRHLTIERKACYEATSNLHGNLWMKDESGFNGKTGSKGGEFANNRPGLHRFLRFDGKRIPLRKAAIDAPPVDGRAATLAQYGYFSAGEGGTVELIGKVRSAADRLSIAGTGMVILSEGSELHEGSRSALWVEQGATLVLLQDAFAGTEMTQQRPQCYASMIVGGTLMIGLPDKPIRRDMRFPLSGIRRELINRNPAFSVRSTGSSFVLGKQGRFIIHSVNPQKARVIFTLNDSERALAHAASYRAQVSKARDIKYWNAEGIVCYFGGQTDVDGILFDKVYPGGIIVDPDARARWKNVFYGQHNLAEPEELYEDLTKQGPQEAGPRVRQRSQH